MPKRAAYDIEIDGICHTIPVKNYFGYQYPSDDDQLAALLDLQSDWEILCIGDSYKYATVTIQRDDERINMSSLPFQDKDFDFVICRNVLQQVKDPIQFSKELGRVAKKGFIEVPSSFHEYLFGSPEDRWICHYVNEVLTLETKPYYRHPLGHIGTKLYYNEASFRQSFKYHQRSLFFIQIIWQDSFTLRVKHTIADTTEDGDLQSTQQGAAWLDCALNCMHFDIAELDSKIIHCLKQAESMLPRNKFIFSIKELFNQREASSKDLYLQLISNLQKKDLEQMLRKSGRNTAADSINIDDSHYPVLKQVYRAESSNPLVSVVIRTYNRPDLLSRCLDSLDYQIYPSIEIIVVNDGGEEVNQVLQGRKHPCHYIRHAENIGKAAALNTGLRVARGTYINIVDDDDLLYPDHISLLVALLDHTDYRVAYADSFMSVAVEAEGSWKTMQKQLVYSQNYNQQLLLRTNYLPILCVMFERSLLGESGYADEQFEVLEDWDLWIRMAIKTPFYHVKKVTSEYHQRAEGDNATQNLSAIFSRNQKIMYQKYAQWMEDVVLPEMMSHPKLYRSKLLSFAHFGDSLEEIKTLVPYFIENFYEIPWAELMILHSFDEETIASLTHELPLNAIDNIRFNHLDQPNLRENTIFQQFDFIVTTSEIKSSFYQNDTAPVISHKDMVRAVKNHPLFGMLHPYQKKEPLLSIIVLTKNQLSYTKQCIESIFRHTHLPFELIIVDNGSTDGTKTYLEKMSIKYDNVKLMMNVDNKGYGGGNNQGFTSSKGEYIAVLNNDVIVTKDWANRLIDVMRADPACGIIGPVSNNVPPPQRVIDPLYAVEDLDHYASQHYVKYADSVLHVDRVTGFCMLVKKEVIDTIGGFDIRYQYGNFEDDDFCIRAMLAGYQCLIAQGIFVHHFGSITFKNEKDVDFEPIYYANFFKFKEKWNMDFPEDGVFTGWNRDDIKEQEFNIGKHYCPFLSDNSVSNFLEQSSALFKQNKYLQCEAVLLQCLDIYGEQPVVRYNLLVNYMQAKNLEKAADCFLYLDENMIEIGRLKAIWHVWMKQVNDAKKLIERLVKRNPNNQELLETQKFVEESL